MKKELCFFTGISPNMTFAAASIAIGLSIHNKIDYDYIVFHSGISDKNRVAFSKIRNCQLREFSFKKEFEETMLSRLPQECRFKNTDRLMCFTHYEIFKLLEEYKCVVWIDSDVLIQDDITNIRFFENMSFASDDDYCVRDQFTTLPNKKYDYDKKAIRISMMCMRDNIPFRDMYKWCYSKTVELVDYLFNPEQAIFNLLLQEWSIIPDIIPLEWHADCDKKEAVITKVVHFGTENKVWNNKSIFDAYPEWYRNIKKWIELGGDTSEDFKLVGVLPQNIINKMRLRTEQPFMFEKVPPGSRVVIYGFGNVGKWYIEQIQSLKYCEIVAVADASIDDNTYNEYGLRLIQPECLYSIPNFDYVIVAIENKRVCSEIEAFLLRNGLKKEKIVRSDYERKY